MNRKPFLFIGIAMFLIGIISIYLVISTTSTFSIYPNADFERVEGFSISRDTFPFIITAPNNSLPPCVRVSYQFIYSTRDGPPQVADWFQDNGWSTGVGTNRASGMKRSFTDLPVINFANWMWVAIKEQTGGWVQIEIDRVHVICVFL